MNFECWTVGTWAIGTWAIGSWCPSAAPAPAPDDTNARGGDGRRDIGPARDWYNYQKEEEDEMKLSQLLAQQLQDAIKMNQMLMKARIQADENLAPVVDRVANSVDPPKPEMDPARKAELMKRLELARQAKEEKRRQEEEFAKQRNRNLAKARRVKAKNRK